MRRAAPRPTRVDDMILPPVALRREGRSRSGCSSTRASAAVAWRGPDAAPHHPAVPHRRVLRRPRRAAARPAARHRRRRDLGRAAAARTPRCSSSRPRSRPPPTSPSAAALVARQTGQTVIGVIENMAGLAQPDGTVLDLFGSRRRRGGRARLSAGQDEPVPLLASVPLSVPLRAGGDAGAPIVLDRPGRPGGGGHPRGRGPPRHPRPRPRRPQARPLRPLTPHPPPDPSCDTCRARPRIPACTRGSRAER